MREERIVKRWSKRKVPFTQSVLVVFLITGFLGIGINIFAGSNNAMLPAWA